jgi:hypothetical protein
MRVLYVQLMNMIPPRTWLSVHVLTKGVNILNAGGGPGPEVDTAQA